MAMGKFGFIVHPIDARRDAARKFPWARWLPVPLIEQYLKRTDPMVVGHAQGIRSQAGATAEGWFVACPLTPRQMLSLPVEAVLDRIVRAGELAAEQGAKVVGLGAYTSVVADGGITIDQRLPVAVTTGNSYTVATALGGTYKAAEMVGTNVAEAKAAILGATGSIGKTCAEALASRVRELTLVGRDLHRLEEARKRIAAMPSTVASLAVSTDIQASLPEADLVLTVTSAVHAVIEPAWLKRGAVVCDVARPRDVSKRVVEERDDVLVIEGGVVRIPGQVSFGFRFGFPEGVAYACMAETMLLALEERYESFTLGKEVTIEQVDEMNRLARKHGFDLAGFRSFERPVTDEQIQHVRERAGRAPAVISVA
ncbi:MAG TPA: shikimate dehydrogenase [Armatimonadota bacterium]